MKEMLLVFFGGGLGSMVRFVLSRWVSALHDHPFPWGTLTANLVACFTLGLAIGLADHKQIIGPDARLFWTVGFCGGFSTFSTFSNETLQLIQSGWTGTTMVYVGGSVVLCLGATLLGLFVGEHL